jgi:formylglycine-generating enzyme required for sulfatase activity
MCGALTASGALCAAEGTRAGCGDVLTTDVACGGQNRFAHCGACTGSTEGMVRIPGATFAIGATLEAVARGEAFENEAPMRPVRVPSFWLDALEVSAGDFATWCSGPAADRDVCARALASEAPCTIAIGTPALPMNCVDWASANAYCSARGKRLPTEEEWDLAARGLERRRYPWGSALPETTDACMSSLANLRVAPCPVGTRADDITPEGVRDLGGNVLEWTSSGGSARLDAPRTASVRVLRGGSWVVGEANAASTRQPLSATKRNLIIGFRCAR